MDPFSPTRPPQAWAAAVAATVVTLIAHPAASIRRMGPRRSSCRPLGRAGGQGGSRGEGLRMCRPLTRRDLLRYAALAAATPVAAHAWRPARAFGQTAARAVPM